MRPRRAQVAGSRSLATPPRIKRGYTDKTKNSTVPAPTPDKRRPALEMLQAFPLGVWFETSFTSTQKALSGSQNGSFEFPQDISLFLAGAWSEHLGSFLQVTYDAQADHFGMDNTDIRYARKTQKSGKDWIYGITFNNNPTVEDLWSSTPAWGYPFMANDSAPGPAAGAIIQGGLAQDVAGDGGYSSFNGGTTNYDGSGRNATDNNAAYLLARFMF